MPKISELTAATYDQLDGAEVLPIVDSGTTKKLSIAEFEKRANKVGTSKPVDQGTITATPTTVPNTPGKRNVWWVSTASGAVNLSSIGTIGLLPGQSAIFRKTTTDLNKVTFGATVGGSGLTGTMTATLDRHYSADQREIELVWDGSAWQLVAGNAPFDTYRGFVSGTDITTLLQTALTAGGDIDLPAGTFTISWGAASYGVRMSANGTRLRGAGRGKTILSMAPASSPTSTTSYGVLVGNFGGGVSNCEISDLTIQSAANVAVGKSVYNLRVQECTNFVLRNVEVIGPDSLGSTAYTTHSPETHIRGSQGGTHAIGIAQSDYVLVDNCDGRDTVGAYYNYEGAYGLELDSCKYARVVNCRFTNNYFDGIKTNNNVAGRAENNVIERCYLADNGQVVANAVTDSGGTVRGNGNGIDIGCSNVTLIGCLAELNYGAGIQVKAVNIHSVNVTNCTSRLNRTSASDKQAGFSVYIDNGLYLSASSGQDIPPSNVIFSGCHAIENDGIGFDLTTAVDCIVTGCISRSNGSHGVRLGQDCARAVLADCRIMGNGRTDVTSTAYGVHLNGAGNTVKGCFISGVDSLKEEDNYQTEYRANTPWTDRGIQVNSTTGAEIHFVFDNIIELMAASLYIQVSSGSIVKRGNFLADGTPIADTNATSLILTDSVSAPSTVSGSALLYVDSADGDLKVKFGDGTTKTIVVDT